MIRKKALRLRKESDYFLNYFAVSYFTIKVDLAAL